MLDGLRFVFVNISKCWFIDSSTLDFFTLDFFWEILSAHKSTRAYKVLCRALLALCIAYSLLNIA